MKTGGLDLAMADRSVSVGAGPLGVNGVAFGHHPKVEPDGSVVERGRYG